MILKPSIIVSKHIRVVMGAILIVHFSTIWGATSSADKKANALHVYPIQSKKFFAEMSAIYGSLSDGGTNLTPFAETIVTNNQADPAAVNSATNYSTKLGVNWGYQATLGYFLSENHHYALITNFLGLDNRRTIHTGKLRQLSYLYNELTQLGNSNEPGNYGFSIFYGPGSGASSTASIQYQRLNIHLEEPWDDLEDTAKIFDFHKTKGIMAVRIAKGVEANYHGDILIGFQNAFPLLSPDTHDSILYAANSLGVGPELGIIARGRLTDKLTIHLTAESAILAGYYNAHYRENATTKESITIGNNNSTRFTNNENHSSSSWTPVFFDVQVMLETKLWESKKHHCNLNGSGGLGGEYILPTFTNNGVSGLLGTPLEKFNNNLSVSYAIIRLSLNTD